MNILNLIESQLSPGTIGQISNTVGEAPEATKSALGAAVPGLLGALLGKASASPNGVTDIFNTIKQGQWPESASDAVNATSGAAPSAAHQSLLNSLLGSKLGPVSDFIASRAGIRSGSAMTLLSMAAPLLMGSLGKHVSSQGLGAEGLGQFLNSQVPYVQDALPGGLANTLGINNLLSGAQKIAAPVADTSYRQPARAAAPAAGGFMKWAWVPVILALIGWLIARHANRGPAVGGTPERNFNTVATGHGYGNLDFSSLNLPPGGVADNLAKAISSGDWNKTIDLQGITTDSAGALTDSAKAGIGEISKVLSAAPSVKVRITGHGATEEAGVNQANSIKGALVSSGVSEDRISTIGQTGAGVPTVNLMH